MTERTVRLRAESLAARPSISPERARLVTEFYQANAGRYSTPVMRARCFHHLCQHKTVFLGNGELIVGERGPRPKATPTFPELTCHSLEDLEILHRRPLTHYDVDAECVRLYGEQIIPYWRGRSLRDRIFAELPPEWKEAYAAGLFTEFMEQRAPGHTVLDGKIYRKGLREFKADIAAAEARLDFLTDPEALDRREALKSFAIACDAVMLFAARHTARARDLAARELDPQRRTELERIAEVCARVPAEAPRDFQEALQHYWFCHLAVITELNGWDSFNPGHLDQHLLPFYRQGLAEGTLTRERARELLECFFVKFNNHLAPPKVGVTAAESGTYTDFANINLGGLLPDGADGANEVSHLLLEIVEELHLLQPSTNIQLSRKSPDALLKHALRVIRLGYGFPSVFNADAVVQEQLRQGKTLEDARAGGCSGCVEVGAFGKEAYILTGYFNLPKVLELALHNGVDPLTGRQLGPCTGEPASLASFDDLFAAYGQQFRHFLDLKLRGNQLIGRLYAKEMPAPFLSVLIDDCIARGRDYNAGGARYNNTYVQFVGLGSLTDSLSAVRELCFDDAGVSGPLGTTGPDPVLGTTRGPRVASGGPPDAADGESSRSEGTLVSLEPASGARYSRRNLPHFERPWAIYHVTFSTVANRRLAPEDRDLVLDCIRHWDDRRYRLTVACIMPDHVHVILQPGIASQDADGSPIFHSLTTILHTIKSFTAHQVNRRSKTSGSLWEKESFDRYMRSDSDLEEKFNYICRNPWEAGVVGPDEPYPWLWAAGFKGITSGPLGTTRGPRVASGGPPDAVPGGPPDAVPGGRADAVPGGPPDAVPGGRAAVGSQTVADEVSAGRRNPHAGGVCSPGSPDSPGSPSSAALSLGELVRILDADFAGAGSLRQRLRHKTHKYGNDDDAADDLMVRIFNTCVEELDGRPDTRGGRYRVEMLPTTCHVYFGSVTGALPDGRHARQPLSEGISPVQGADRRGPTAVIKSAAKLDHLKAGGTLLNLKFTPGLVSTEEGIDKWASLVRSYFKMDGHHVQFNVVRADALREAQARPEEHGDLIVRVAGYSDYFCDLARELQDEIIERTEHESFSG
jgi:formate C-acetyltransferase